jgi:hypothetical protein
MNKRFLSIVISTGILVLAGAGCGKGTAPSVQKQTNIQAPAVNQKVPDGAATGLPGAPSGTTTGVQPSKGGITSAECADLMATTRYSSYLLTVKKDPFTSAIWSKKLYDDMDAYGVKYGVTRDEIAAACRARINEQGLNEEVDKRLKIIEAGN